MFKAFREAPVRTQIQIIAWVAVSLMSLLILGSLYLTVAASAATAGRDLQSFEIRKAELIIENNQLRAELADLRSMTRMASRALELGFVPAQVEQMDYIFVANYPHATLLAAQPVSATVPTTASAPTATPWAVAFHWLSDLVTPPAP